MFKFDLYLVWAIKNKSVKKFVLITILFIPIFTFGKYEYPFMQEFFFGRLPSARAEAMGKSYCSIDGDLTTVYFNPSGIATIKELEIDYSLASPYYLLDKAKYNFISVGYKFNKYLILGLTRNHFTFGTKIDIVDQNGDVIGFYDSPHYSNYSLTIASQPIKNLFLGLNINYLLLNPINIEETTFYFDFGIIKKFQFLQKEKTRHFVSIGASITNFNSAKILFNFNGIEIKNSLPVISRLGANYEFTLDKHKLIDTLQTARFILQGEYQKLLNSEYESAIRSGCELMFLEILSFRAGYYKEKIYDFGIPSVNYSELGGWTLGIGLQIPLYKLTNVPLNINFDYTSLQQPSATSNYPTWDNFTTYNVRLNWIFNNKK